MKITPQQYATALFDAIDAVSPKDHDHVLDNFVKILAQNGDLEKYQEIEVEFKKIDMKAKGIQEAKVTVARKIEINSNLIDELNRIINSSPRDSSSQEKMTLSVKTEVDESIIGGIVVRMGDTLIDASMRGQLNKLKETIKN